jgi:hypothetical protein
VGSEIRQAIDLPLPGSRATTALVVAIWNANAKGPTLLAPSLLLAVENASVNPKAEADALETFRLHADQPLVSRTHRSIESTLPEDEDIKAIAASLAIGLFHGEAAASVRIPATIYREGTIKSWESCGSCHASAFAAWRNSRHSAALLSLAEVGKHRAGQCLSCHVQSVNTDKALGAGVLAVTCFSCHDDTTHQGEASVNGPRGVCVKCHTPITDPKGNYKLRLKTICPPEDSGMVGDCSRRQVRK